MSAKPPFDSAVVGRLPIRDLDWTASRVADFWLDIVAGNTGQNIIAQALGRGDIITSPTSVFNANHHAAYYTGSAYIPPPQKETFKMALVEEIKAGYQKGAASLCSTALSPKSALAIAANKSGLYLNYAFLRGTDIKTEITRDPQGEASLKITRGGGRPSILALQLPPAEASPAQPEAKPETVTPAPAMTA